MRSIHLVSDTRSRAPGLDTGISHAVVRAVGSRNLDETIRLHRTGPIVAFGRRDVVSNGFRAAVAQSRLHGFVPVERLAGGRAAVFHEQTIAFSWAIPTADPRVGVEARFREIADILQEALTSMGVQAGIGEIPGEYCPGAYSINARGRTKIMGVGQRLVRGAAHIGGVIVVDGHHRIRQVLEPVYEALDIDWDPQTVGSVAAEIGNVSLEEVETAVRIAFERRFDLLPTALPQSILVEAQILAGSHVVES